MSGSNLAAFVINPTDEELRYGLRGTFDHWSGSTWEPAGSWTTSLDFLGGFGSISPDAGVIRTIGLIAPAHGIGPGEYFSVQSQQPGWYRIGHGGAYGMFEVSEAAPVTPPLSGQSATGALVTVSPTLFGPSGGPARLVGTSRSPGITTSDDQHRFNRGFDSSVTLERWADEYWMTVGMIALQTNAEPVDNPVEAVVTIPPLPGGTYRLVCRHLEVGNLTRVFWITDSLPIGSGTPDL
jgi:hypothetical protein